MLVAGRVIAGISVGLSSAVVPIYQSEITAPHIRGRMVSLQQWYIFSLSPHQIQCCSPFLIFILVTRCATMFGDDLELLPIMNKKKGFLPLLFAPLGFRFSQTKPMLFSTLKGLSRGES